MKQYGKNLDKVVSLGFGGILLIAGSQHLFPNVIKLCYILIVTLLFHIISSLVCHDIKRLEPKLHLILFLGMLLIFSMSVGIGEMLQYLIGLYF